MQARRSWESETVESQSVRLSRTVPEKRKTSCSTVAIEVTKTEREISFLGLPSNKISPDQCSYSPDTNLATVDFPEPLPPTKAIRCPGWMVQLKFSMRGLLTLAYPKLTLRSSICPCNRI